jgi:hypothetical protein
MDFDTARRRKWAVKIFMTKGLESHHTITLSTLSKYIKAKKKELSKGETLKRPLTPLLPWVVEIAFQDYTNSFGELGTDLISMCVKEQM